MRFRFWAIATLVAIVAAVSAKGAADAIGVGQPGARDGICTGACTTAVTARAAGVATSVARSGQRILLASASEPASLLLLGSGLGLIAFRLRRGRRNR